MRGAGKFTTRRKKMRPPARCVSLSEEMQTSGLRAPGESELQSCGRASRHARNRLRFRGGHDHAAAHGAQPRRIRAWGVAAPPRWIAGKKGLFEFREILGELTS